jgi:hypothetical protein
MRTEVETVTRVSRDSSDPRHIVRSNGELYQVDSVRVTVDVEADYVDVSIHGRKVRKADFVPKTMGGWPIYGHIETVAVLDAA